jgi:hypothetical protein
MGMSETRNERGAGRKPIGSGKLKGRTYGFLATKEEAEALERLVNEAIKSGKALNKSDYFIKCALRGL